MAKNAPYLILTFGITTSILLGAIILISLYQNPRIWLRKLPGSLSPNVPPKSGSEKLQSRLILIVFMGILILLPATAIYQYAPTVSVWQAATITYGILFIFNLADLLIIDWLIICTITPAFIKIKGIDERAYKSYGRHFMDFVKGSIYLIVPALCSALLGIFAAGFSWHQP